MPIRRLIVVVYYLWNDKEQLGGMNQTMFYDNLKILNTSFDENVCYFIEYLFSMSEYMYLALCIIETLFQQVL